MVGVAPTPMIPRLTVATALSVTLTGSAGLVLTLIPIVVPCGTLASRSTKAWLDSLVLSTITGIAEDVLFAVTVTEQLVRSNDSEHAVFVLAPLPRLSPL